MNWLINALRRIKCPSRRYFWNGHGTSITCNRWKGHPGSCVSRDGRKV